jgi:hypothetical protein
MKDLELESRVSTYSKLYAPLKRGGLVEQEYGVSREGQTGHESRAEMDCDHLPLQDVILEGNWWTCSQCGERLEHFTALPDRPITYIRRLFGRYDERDDKWQ